MSKQLSLGAFGFTKIVTNKDGKPEFRDISTVAEKPKAYTCEICKEKFGNAGALSTHTKCKHGVVPESKSEESKPSSSNCEKIPVIDGGEVPSSSSGKRKVLKAKRSYEHLKKKRISYTAAFKAQVINDHENGTTVVEITDKYSNFRVDKSKVSRWLSKKEAIKKAALGEHKNLLKIRPGTKYNELYAQLKPVFEDARKKGHRVDFNWLWSKARNIYRSQNGDDAVLGKHVIATFIRRHHLKYRRVQRNKNQSKEAYREKLQKWHYTLRERLVRTGSTSKDYDTKWGYYQPKQRLNVDQSPLPFATECKKT